MTVICSGAGRWIKCHCCGKKKKSVRSMSISLSESVYSFTWRDKP
jgi:hypothetical protein